jgi:hypothetical protein
LKRVREVELAADPRRPAHHLRDPIEQRAPVANVVQADVGKPRDRRARLLDDAGHQPAFVRHQHPEPLVILDVLRPDDAVRVARFHQRHVGVEQRVHEHNQDRTIHIRPRQVDRAGGAIERLLLNECRSHGIVLDDVVLDDFFR